MNEIQKTIDNTNNFLKQEDFYSKYDLALEEWEMPVKYWRLIVIIQYSLIAIGVVGDKTYFFLFSVLFALMSIFVAYLILKYKDEKREQVKKTIINQLGNEQGQLVIDTFYNSEEEPNVYEIVNEQAKKLQGLMNKKEYSDYDLDFLKDLYH